MAGAANSTTSVAGSGASDDKATGQNAAGPSQTSISTTSGGTVIKVTV